MPLAFHKAAKRALQLYKKLRSSRDGEKRGRVEENLKLFHLFHKTRAHMRETRTRTRIISNTENKQRKITLKSSEQAAEDHSQEQRAGSGQAARSAASLREWAFVNT